MIAFIDKYRDRYGVEFICTTLAHHHMGGFMSARGYRAAKKRLSSKRSLRECELIPVMIDLHRENYGMYGVRKMWHAMKRAGYSIGRDQVARLMKMADMRGVIRGRKPITTKPAKTPDLRPDLVKRNFRAPGPNRLWVADITYVKTRDGFVYTAFVTDVYSRKIVGWATKSCLTTEALPLEALNHAVATAKGSLEKLVHHSDHGSQYVSIAYHERLRDAGINESTCSVGDFYDNALAETVNGLYKSEVIYSQTWEGLAEVEWETLCWVYWWNTTRLHSELGYRAPQEVEDHYWHTHRANTQDTSHRLGTKPRTVQFKRFLVTKNVS